MYHNRVEGGGGARRRKHDKLRSVREFYYEDYDGDKYPHNYNLNSSHIIKNINKSNSNSYNDVDQDDSYGSDDKEQK